MLCPRRKVLFATKFFIAIWGVILLYLYFNLDVLPMPWGKNNVHTAFLKWAMRSGDISTNASIHVPLSDFIFGEYNTLSFYDLPKRKRGVSYTEITSANRATSYTHAPDFTFHIEYGPDHVVLYQDEGVGCVHRIYLFPVLPTHTDLLYKMTSNDLEKSFIVYIVDGTEYKYSLKLFMEGVEWPFLAPLNTKHKFLASGMGSYMPICYQKSMKIIYMTGDMLPPDLLAKTVNCSIHDLLCPVHIYSAVSRMKYPNGELVEAFAGSTNDGGYVKRTRRLAKVLEHPEYNGPDAERPCRLTCIEMCKGCNRIIFSQNSPGVISAVKVRVFETATGKLRTSWADILFSASFDNASPPQINEVPLGSLFGATASSNEFGAATFGKRKKKCAYGDFLLAVPKVEITGFFYFPMPFWKSVRLTLDGTEFIDTPLLVCYEVTIDDNFYEQVDTGYFHADKTYYTDTVSGYREVLNVEGAWGQVVGLTMDVDNLRAIRNVPVNERWAPLEADPLIYVDGSKAASVLGTGLEDYFSYSHGFAMAENTTYAFVGNYHATPKQKEPLTWHCYRLHITDPIYFQNSIEFIMEGMSMSASQLPEAKLSYEEHVKRKMAGEGCLSHLVMYYMGTTSGVTTTDVFRFSNDISEQEHQFEVVHSQSDSAGRIFHIANKLYLGASNRNKSQNVSGRKFAAGDKFSFTMMSLSSNRGVILRREFHSLPWLSWNEQASIWVNDKHVGVWFIPMGALSEEYSLREEDFSVGSHMTKGQKQLRITIEAQTSWNDISYRLLSVN